MTFRTFIKSLVEGLLGWGNIGKINSLVFFCLLFFFSHYSLFVYVHRGLFQRDSLPQNKKENSPYNQSPRLTNVLDTIFLPKIFSSVAYGTSHIGIIALTRVLARTITADPRGDILINSVSTKVRFLILSPVLPILHAESSAFLISG